MSITKWLLTKGYIQPDDAEVYVYGFDITIASLWNNFLLIALSFLFGNAFRGLVYSLAFTPIRVYGGGYHLKTHWGCTLMTLGSFIVCYWGTTLLMPFANPFLLGGLFLVILLICLWKAPVVHPNNPIAPEKHPRLRFKCILGVVLAFGVCFALYFARWNVSYALMIAFTQSAAALSLLFANKAEPNSAAI